MPHRLFAVKRMLSNRCDGIPTAMARKTSPIKSQVLSILLKNAAT